MFSLPFALILLYSKNLMSDLTDSTLGTLVNFGGSMQDNAIALDFGLYFGNVNFLL